MRLQVKGEAPVRNAYKDQSHNRHIFFCKRKSAPHNSVSGYYFWPRDPCNFSITQEFLLIFRSQGLIGRPTMEVEEKSLVTWGGITVSHPCSSDTVHQTLSTMQVRFKTSRIYIEYPWFL